MQEYGVGGRHRKRSNVGKEAWRCAYYGRGHRTELVRYSVENSVSITHSC